MQSRKALLPKDQMELLYEKCIEQRCSDSDLMDLCEEHNIPLGTAYRQLAIWCTPDECQGCVHITMWPHMPPCASCKRSKRDLYEPENTEE